MKESFTARFFFKIWLQITITRIKTNSKNIARSFLLSNGIRELFHKNLICCLIMLKIAHLFFGNIGDFQLFK
jgi:hypothetical protein